MQPGRTTNTGGGTMEVKAAAPRCQLLLIFLMSAVMLLPGTNGSLLLFQRTVTRTIMLQETIGKETLFIYTVFQFSGFMGFLTGQVFAIFLFPKSFLKN
ncbi:hypothetical protein STEG23_030542, partial [Scotinomys teguina]